MPTFQVTGPDGKKYRVSGENAQGAYEAVQQMIGAGQANGAAPAEAQPTSFRDAQRQMATADRGVLGAASTMGAQGATANFGDELFASLLGAPIEMAIGAYTGEDEGKSLGERYTAGYDRVQGLQKAQREAIDEQHPVASVAGQVLGGVASAKGLPSLMSGAKTLPAMIGRGATEAAAYGGVGGFGAGSGLEDRLNRATEGVVGGAAIGAGLPVVAAGGRRALDAVTSRLGSAETQARQRIIQAAQRAGLDDAAIRTRLDELGPEAMLIDALGTEGQALGRSARNVSPQAQSVLDQASSARMATQNDRVVGAMERASGLPSGSRSSLDDLKEAAYERVAPQIGEAYREARAAGYELPLDGFQDIFQSPMVQQELRKAVRSSRNRAAMGEQGAESRLGILDQLKRGLDSRASVAARAGDKDTADQARRLARALRERTDEALAGPQPAMFELDGSGSQLTRANPYARARRLRQDAYRTDEAFDLGAELARGRVPLDGPTRARAIEEQNRQALAQGYTATQAGNLLNRRGTPGSIDSLNTRLGREAMEAALGSGAAPVRRQLDAEAQFGQTHRSLTGNSTTAQQLAAMGATPIAGAGAGLAMGMDFTGAGLAAVGADLGRRSLAAGIRKLGATNEAAVAPKVAQFLVANGLPPTQQGALIVMRSPKLRKALAAALGLVAGQEVGASVMPAMPSAASAR